MSTLKRLFEYTETAQSGPLENFTTEALAGAIASDWAPILDVLGQHGIVTPDLVTDVEPFTQYHVTDGTRSGYVDLVLQVQTETGPHEVWCENKVWAPESGSQLAFYASVIANATHNGIVRHLVVIAPHRISDAVDHVFIPWQRIAAAARRHQGSLWWAELAQFLEEIRMTEDTTLPVTAGEAASLDDAHHLFVKVRAIMVAANVQAVEVVPEWRDHWWPESHITRALMRSFVEKGRYTLTSGWGHQAFLVWGAVPHPDGVWFVVWVESEPKRTAARSELLRSVEGRLAGWSRPHGRWAILAAERRAVTFETEDEAVEWFMDRLRDLRDAGVLGLIPMLGKGPVVDEPEGDMALADEEADVEL